MLPETVENIEEIASEVDSIQIPSGSWKLFSEYTQAGEQVEGVDDVKQGVYFILSTEKDKFLIYDWQYGIETLDLIGQPMDYIMAELQVRIKEALLWDERITDVTDFDFEVSHRALHVTFTVHTEIDEFEAETEVEV